MTIMLNSKWKVLLIPGGPGLCSKYLDPLAETLKELENTIDFIVFRIETVNVDNTTSYEDYLSRISLSLSELGLGENVIVVAHSFGVTLLSDLIKNCLIAQKHSILLNWPSSGISQIFFEKLKNFNFSENDDYTDEKIFRNNWEKMLPLYFTESKVEEWQKNLLVKNTFWLKTQHFQKNALECRDVWKLNKGIYITSDNDILMNESEWSWAQETFGNENSYLIENYGHFPMLERTADFAIFLLQRINSCVTNN